MPTAGDEDGTLAARPWAMIVEAEDAQKHDLIRRRSAGL
jgi:hypothetical protein